MLFHVDSWQAREMRDDEVPALQAFFEANPLYFEKVNGRGPTPGEGQLEYDDLPPPELPFGKRWMLVVTDDAGEWIAVAQLLSDFLQPRVWHIGLFILATRLHGGGHAQALYRAMEQWMVKRGAQWLRLGAVVGWHKAENFWSRQGYVEVRTRQAPTPGEQINTVRVMVKPLGGGQLADYLQMVQRDNPGQP